MVKTSEKLLISKLKELRSIKPEKEWVSLTKTRILGEERGFHFFPYFQPALAAAAFALVLFVFGFAQNSVPGDFLYSVKKITERGQAIFVSEQARPQANLELVAKRAEELARVAASNQTSKLPQAINEFQASVSEANKILERNTDPVAVKRIIDQVKENVQTTSSLGVVVDIEGFNELEHNYDAFLAKYLVADLATRTLTERQTDILGRMTELVSQGKYAEALILHSTEFDEPTASEVETAVTEEETEPDEETEEEMAEISEE